MDQERTLVLGSAVDLGYLLLNEFVSLLADGDDLLAGNAKLRHGGKDLLGDGSSRLPFGKVIWVGQGVIYT